jgi:hypothetical protein
LANVEAFVVVAIVADPVVQGPQYPRIQALVLPVSPKFSIVENRPPEFAAAGFTSSDTMAFQLSPPFNVRSTA